MRIALVLNAGSGSIDDPEDVVALLRDHGATEILRFAPGEHDAAVASAPDRLVVASGDGTVAPVARAAAEADVPLGILPGGTANDFARAMGIPLDLAAAAALAVDPAAATRPVEVH